MNEDILKQRYSDYRIRMKSANTVDEKRSIKKEMSEFLRYISEAFGQEVVSGLTKKK